MSENLQSTVGQLLNEARVAQGVTVEDAAVRLRLMNRQIEAMEADDFESLGQPVFARGFVRNYARLLGLAPEPLLERMVGAPAEPEPITHAEAPMPRSWMTSPWLILLLLGMLVLVAAPVGLYLWLNSEVEEGGDAPFPVVQTQPAPLDAPAVAMPAPMTEASPESAQEAAAPAGEAAQPGEGADTVESAQPAAKDGVVRLEFGDESWVEIKDASGRMLHRQLNPAGSGAEIRGQPPFSMVIGNAAAARMTYNGRPIDLKPFIDVTVARFTLEE